MWQGWRKLTQRSLLLGMSRLHGALVVVCSLLLLLIPLSYGLTGSIWTATIVIGVCVLFVLALARPMLALLLVFVGAGLPSVLLPMPGHTIRLIEPALLLCIAIVALRRPGARFHLAHALMLLFILIALISFFHVPTISTDRNAYAADKRLYELFLAFIAFFCGTFLVRYVRNASSFLVAILLCNLPLYGIGAAQSFGIPLPAPLEFAGAQELSLTQGRLWGPTPGAATFGLYLVNLLAVAFACSLLATRKRDRLIGIGMMLLTVLELVGSGTRSAALGGFCLIIVALILTKRLKLLVGVLMVITIAIAGVLGSVLPLFTHDPTSVTNRLLLWQEALKLILAHPWIGMGLQQFPTYYSQLIISPSSALNAHGISVHNQYLELAMESGVAWLIIAVLFLLSTLDQCRRIYRVVQGEVKCLVLAALLALIANIVTCCFDVPLDKAEGAVFLFLLLGMALGYVPQYVPWRKALKESTAALRLPLFSSYSPTRSRSIEGAPSAHKAARSITIQLVCWIITIPAIFPVTALLTRYFGPVQYGEYSFTLPFLAICALLSGTGMDPLIIRCLSRQPRDGWSNILSYAASTRLISTTFSIILVCLLALALPVTHEQRLLLVLGSVSLFFSFSFNGLRSIYSHGFRAEQRIGILMVLETGNRLFTACIVLFVVAVHLPFLWCFVLLIYSDVPLFLVQIMIARKRFAIKLRFSLARMREYLRDSLSLTGYDALALMNSQSDVILLMLLAGPLEGGLYALGIRLTDPLLTISFAYVNGLYPLLCSTFSQRKEQFAKLYYEAIRILALVIAPLVIFISVEAEEVVALLGGQRFMAANTVVQLLIWATAAAFFGQIAVQTCMAANMERLIPRVAGVVACVNVLGNLLLIPLWHAEGAGIAAVISESTSLLLFTVLLRPHIRLLPIIGTLFRVFLGNVPAMGFLIWQQHATLFLTIPLYLMLTLLGCFLARALSWHDLTLASRFLLFRRTASLAENMDGTINTPAANAHLPTIDNYPTLPLPRIDSLV